MGRKTGPGEVGIEKVRERFEQWRNSRSQRARIPDELWRLAIDIARRSGVNRTAQELHLDGGKLKRLLLAAGPSVGKLAQRARGPRFVELIAPVPTPTPDECLIEFESPGGNKMRIHWRTATPQWANLLRAWRDAER